MEISYITSAILLLLGAVVFCGKGDFLIAGYNTSSEEEKAKYHIKRLRGLIGGNCVLVAALALLLRLTEIGKEIFAPAIVASCVLVIVLANTWAKKKNR